MEKNKLAVSIIITYDNNLSVMYRNLDILEDPCAGDLLSNANHSLIHAQIAQRSKPIIHSDKYKGQKKNKNSN